MSKASLTKIMMKSGMKQIFYSNNQGVYNLNSQLCQVDRAVCKEGLLLISEKNNSVNNIDRMPVIMGHFPSGSSVKNFDHFSQYTKV